MEGNLRFKIGWAILIVGSKFIVFALFYFAYIWRGDLMQGFLRYRFGGLILILEGLIFGIVPSTMDNNIIVFEWEKYYCPQPTCKREPWEPFFKRWRMGLI